MKATDEFKKIFTGKVRENVPLKTYSTFRVGGPADLFITATNKDELKAYITHAIRLEIPYVVLGGLSNILVGDRGFSGLVIRNQSNKITLCGMKGIMRQGTSHKVVLVEVESGTPMNSLVRYTIEEGLGGLEWHLGLPGSVGGALYMNSKWSKPEVHYVGDALERASVISKSGVVREMKAHDFHFGYDTSVLQETHETVLTAVFALENIDTKTLWERANASILHRKQSQPMGVASPGCTFRNISHIEAMTANTPNHTTSAGFLVDNAGLKGITSGGIRISDVHANFLVNDGSGTAHDVVQLISVIKERVKAKFGIELHEEIVYIGKFS